MKPSTASHSLHIDLAGTGINKYPAKQHALNVARHLKDSHGLIYIPGQHRLSVEDSDFFYPFRQRRAFYYMSGVDEPDWHLVYDIGTDELVLYLPEISAKKAVWFGRGYTLDEARAKYDFDDVCWSSDLDTDLQQWIDDHPTSNVFILHPAQTPSNLPRPPKYDKTSLQPAVAASRVIKDSTEIALIRHAIAISSSAHATVMHHITTLRSEAEVQGLFEDICTSSNAHQQAYEPIIASGTNASILHYTANNRRFEPSTQLLCLDAGCESTCYASDITRTFPLNPSGAWPTIEAESLYRLVALMQETCIAALKPGVHFSALFRLARQIATRGLIQLGVLRIRDCAAEIDDFIDSGGINAFFPHGLGHHVGLDVHDVGPIDSQPTTTTTTTGSTSPHITPPYSPKPWTTHPLPLLPPCTSSSIPLAPGMVITVEPGLYFNAYTLNALYLCHAEFKALVNLDVLERYISVGGVRIEDDVLITPEGYENLTTAPKGERMLEIIREGARCGHGCECPYRIGRAGR